MRIPWDAPVETLHGVGPERTAQLARLGIHRVGDLLLHRPRRYEDRRNPRPIAELADGESALVRGQVLAAGVKFWQRRRRSVFELVLEDGTGRLHCRWWNAPYLERQFHVGQHLVAFGRVSGLRPRAMDHPETEALEETGEDPIHVNRIVPVHPLTEGVSARWLRGLIWRVLAQGTAGIPDCLGGSVPAGLPSGEEALRQLHFPADASEAERARRRLALEELVALQLELQRRRQRLQARALAPVCAGDNRLIRPFLRGLGFSLTPAQTRVLREIRLDLAGPAPMRRLLQGDVGSGKTVVAAGAALMALESGHPVAFMVPTEILADQHSRNLRRWLEPLGVPVLLHTGSRPDGGCTGEPGPPRLLVGTHALATEGFEIDRLGLVIIDEQHKFGVAQREALVRKGTHPHLLVMTATPIPRTLGLTLYGDLDLSVIDELPAGRGRVRTFVRGPDRFEKVWEFVRGQLAAGRQAFVVCPRVEDADGDLKSVKREARHLASVLAPAVVGLLHGGLPPAGREQVLRAFAGGEIGVLVASSVIEVGIDVPQATVMVVEQADHFGLAQLHQLRGRVGRGSQESFCILGVSTESSEARARLRVLEETADGFAVAEADLRLRGPGEFLGHQQSGLPPFRFADLAAELPLVEQARALARRILGCGECAGSGKNALGAPRGRSRLPP